MIDYDTFLISSDTLGLDIEHNYRNILCCNQYKIQNFMIHLL